MLNKDAIKKATNNAAAFVAMSANELNTKVSGLKTRHTRIAVTGLSRSGKTVFITSLIDQFKHLKTLKLKDKTITFKAEIKPPKVNQKRFNYIPYAKLIKQEHVWPKGTDSITSTVIEVEIKKSAWAGNRKLEIELIDYPGEWILDIALLGTTYEVWSQKVLQQLKAIDVESVRNYLALLDDLPALCENPDVENRLSQSYTAMLYDLKGNHFSNLTPGRFIMPSDLQDDPLLQFAPLPPSTLPIHATFKARFETYLKEIVEGIQLENFKGFDRQIVLIDVVEALQNGPACHKDMADGIRQMLSIYEHSKKNFILQLFSPSINKVVFVASKADLVTANQRNNYKMLLDEMINEIIHEMDIGHVKTDAMICASVLCTETISAKHEGKPLSMLKGRKTTGQTTQLYPGEMPVTFPANSEWDTDDYQYQEFLPPNIDYRENEAIRNINLENVIRSLLGDLL